MHKINHADIKQWAKDYKGEPFDGILCDPPYELGFMGKSWDSSGIAYDKDMWADLFRHVKPGGHLLAFSGSRTYHRMAVAIEDAGFEIRDMIEWVYGSGFPKSLNIGKAVDKIQGNEREVVGTQTLGGNAAQTTKEKGGTYASNTNAVGVKPINVEITKGTSEWEGYGTALKPAHEPCVLARKPIEGTVANNVLKHGVGGLNIDGSRVGTETTRTTIKDLSQAHGNQFGKAGITYPTQGYKENLPGRFPANLIHDGSDEVVDLFPDSKSGKSKKAGTANSSSIFAGAGRTGNDDYGDSGSAARFFKNCKPDLYCSRCYGIMGACENNANNVQPTSALGTQASNTAQGNVAVKQVQEPKDKQPSKTNNANNAVNSSVSTNQTTVNTVQRHVTQNLKEPLDLAVKYAESQCLKCQTSIAQRLVAMATENMESQAYQDFMHDYKSSTQTESLVSTVAYLANTDITQTTINLMKLCGFAHLATGENTRQANQENNSDTFPLKYQSKASKSERNAGLEGFENNKPMYESHRANYENTKGIETPYAGAGRTGNANQNNHPTVKPLSLTKYLANLIKPPTGGRLLVPFSGSGSEMIGALQAGWEYVEGVELTEEYIPIAEARIKYWLEQIVEADKQIKLV